MKKIIALALCLFMLIALTSCSGGGKDDGRLPKAFGIIKDCASFEKHGRTGESTAFTSREFSEFLGAELTSITVTELPDPERGLLMFRGSGVIKGQTLPASQFGSLRFVPTEGSEGASFVFTCDAPGWEGAGIKCAVTLTDGENSAPTVRDAAVSAVAGVTCAAKIPLEDPDGDPVKINVTAYPGDGRVKIEDGTVIYTPDEDFSGKDALTYTLTDKYGARSAEAKIVFNVEKNEKGLVFADMDGDPDQLDAYRMCVSDVMVYREVDGEYIFEPDSEVKRIDFLVMLMCGTGLDSGVNAVAESVITDGEGLSSGLKGFLAAAAAKGLIRTDRGAFRPNAVITFAEAATMVASAISVPTLVASGGVSGSNADSGAVMSSLIRDGIIESAENLGRALDRRECARMLARAAEYVKNNRPD